VRELAGASDSGWGQSAEPGQVGAAEVAALVVAVLAPAAAALGAAVVVAALARAVAALVVAAALAVAALGAAVRAQAEGGVLEDPELHLCSLSAYHARDGIRPAFP
jgi:hypothetical protein